MVSSHSFCHFWLLLLLFNCIVFCYFPVTISSVLFHSLIFSLGEATLPPLAPQSNYALPLPYVQHPLFIRPKGKETKFSTLPLEWKNVTGSFENVGGFGECVALNGSEEDNYR